MPLVIATWNTQGDPTRNPAKTRVLQNLWTRAHVLLLQECTHFANHHVLDGIRMLERSAVAGAFNQRCSTAIVSRLPALPRRAHSLPSGTGRSLTQIELNGFRVRIGTLHAVSGGVGMQDLAFAARTMATVPGGFIIGGDFNYRPRVGRGRRANRRQIELGTRRRSMRVGIALPQGRTQQNGGRLDHFVFGGGVTGTARRHHERGGSDHWPVLLRVRRSYF